MTDETNIVVLKSENVAVVTRPVEIRVLRVAEPLHILMESDRISILTVGSGPPGIQGPAGGGGGATGRVFFLDPTVASDIAGYTLATEVPPATSPHTHLVRTVTGTGDVLVEEFATIPGVPGATLLPAGIALRVYHANTGASNQVARIKTELYRCEADGTIETFLRQDYTESLFGSGVQEITHVFVFTGSEVLTATQRLVWKVYVARVSGPNSFDVTLHFNGETEVSFIRSTLPTGGGGTGSITIVGDVTSGDHAFEGTAGTTLTSTAVGFNIFVANAPAGDGGIIQITGGSASVGAGGYIQLLGGDALSGNQLGGDVYISSGSSQGTAAGSIISLSAGGAPTSGIGGFIELFAGFSNQNTGGAINLTAGQTGSITGARGGAITLTSGFSGSSAGGASGDITIQTGGTNDADTGAVIIKTANATGTNRSTGDITLTTGTPTGSGTRGSIILDGGVASVKLPGGMLTTANTTNLSLATSSGTQLEVVHIVNPTCWVQTQSGGSGSLIGAKVTGGNGNFFVTSAGDGSIGFTTRGGLWLQFEITHTNTTARWIRVTGATATGDPVLGVNNGTNIAISNVNLIWPTDNFTDIGASGATRPRSGYFGTSIVVGTDPAGSDLLRVGGSGIFKKSDAAGIRVTIENTNTTFSSGPFSQLYLKTASGSAADPYIWFGSTGTSQDWMIGIDHSDGNKFKIQNGTAPDQTLTDIAPSILEFTINGAFTSSWTTSGAQRSVIFENNAGTGTSAGINFDIRSQNTDGDPVLRFRSSASVHWTTGFDASDSNSYKISNGTVLGTNDRIIVTTAGVVTLTNTLTVPLITGGIAEAGSLTLKANTFASNVGSVFVYARNDYLLLTLSTGGSTLTGSLIVQQNTGTANSVILQVWNTTSQDATIKVRTGGTADPIYQAHDETSGQIWSWGLDQSNSDAFVLSSNSTLGTNDRIIVTTAGAITLPGAVTLGSTLTFSTAASKIIPGATSLSLRNNADSADNLLITNAGDATVRLSLTVNNGLSALIGAGAAIQAIRSSGGDRLLITPNGAGAGAWIQVQTDALTDFTGLTVFSAGTTLMYRTGVGSTTAGLTLDNSGDTTLAHYLKFSTAASRIIPGATSLSLRNNADSADNILIADAGGVTLRTTLTFATAASKIIPGATSLALRNNADSADNLLITNAGDVTVRALLDLSTSTAGQIKFPTTQNASSGVKTLDDYEEGTWTPAMTFGNASTGVTYATQAGTYTKVGRLVTCHFRIVLSSKGSSTGTARIAGLPYTSSSDQGNNSGQAIEWGTMVNNFVYCNGIVATSSVKYTLKGITAAAAGMIGFFLLDTDFNNTSEINSTFSYHV